MRALSWSSEEAQAWDRFLRENLGLASSLLMENAAVELANNILQVAKDKGFTKILLLCGTGHNGGDAVTAARHLMGGSLDLRLAFPIGPPRPGGLTEAALQPLARLGLHAEPVGTPPSQLWAGRDLVVDALFGLGLNRPLTGAALDLVVELNATRVPVLAVDVPSGLDATTGASWGAAVRADWTLTFVGPKQGFQKGVGPTVTGQIQIAEIGVRPEIAEAWLRSRRAALSRES